MYLAYDSDNLDDIPVQSSIYAYYNDGEPGTATAAQLARRPSDSKGYPISRTRGVKSYWMDVENGAATVDDFIADFKAGNVKGIYISWARVDSELIPKCEAAGVTGYDLWSAHWGATTLDPGAVWTQYQSPSSNPPTPGHYDLSYVWSNWTPKEDAVTDVPANTVTDVPANTTGSDLNTDIDSPTPAADGHNVLEGKIIGMAVTPSGNGYWLVGADGGVFTFGDAQEYKDSEGRTNLVGVQLAQPVFGICSTRSGQGYYIYTLDGGVFCFGDAAFHGSV